MPSKPKLLEQMINQATTWDNGVKENSYDSMNDKDDIALVIDGNMSFLQKNNNQQNSEYGSESCDNEDDLYCNE